MKKNGIRISTTGVNGGVQSQYKTVGLVNLNIDDDRKTITVDGFDGVGLSSQQRETGKITFQRGNKLIQFESFDNLFDLLEQVMNKLN